MLRPVAVALLGALAACGASESPVTQVAPGLPAIVFTQAERPSILDVPAVQMPAVLKQHYLLWPDFRFIGAVADVHRLLSGIPADTVRLTRRGDRWVITYRGDSVGDLPDLPGYGDGTALLTGWATRLLARYPLDTGAAPTAAERESIVALLEQFDVPHVAAALQQVDARWSRFGRNAAWLPFGASGLMRLAIQLPKTDVLGDPLIARALATTAVAAAAGYRDSLTEIQVLLAEHMGYTREAARLAATLPADNPARLLAIRDRPDLRATATGGDATPLARQLYLSTIADLGDANDFQEAFTAVETGQPTSGMLGAAVTAQRFEADRLLISLAPKTLAGELRSGRVEPPGDGYWERVLHRINRLIGGARRQGGWTDVLYDGGDKALDDFERDVSRSGGQFGGPFLNADLYGLYFRAQLHAAFERACIHYVNGLSSEPAATKFVGSFTAPPGRWGEMVRWCRNRSAVMVGAGSVDQLIEDIRTVEGLSEPAVSRSLDDIDELLRYLDERHLTAAQAAFAVLDSRPHHLREASDIASGELQDIPLEERLDARLLELAAVDYPEIAVWYAQYRGDARALAAQARDRTLTLEARFKALRYLLDISADTAATFAAFERLLAEAPDNWDERRSYVEILERSGRFNDAARVSRAWLAGHDRDRGFDYLFASIALARQYQLLGRLDEAYALLEPLQGSYQAGVLQRSALVALASGKADIAERLARRSVDRYPNSASARATLAEVLWTQRRYGETPAVLHEPSHQLSSSDWRYEIAPAFARVFGRRPVREGQEAFEALIRGGIPNTLIDGLPEATADSGYYPLALALKARILPPPGGDERGDDGAAVEFYRYMVAARGKGAAREWLNTRWGPSQARRQALSIYRNGTYDLLWELNAAPDDGVDGSYYWLVRTLAWIQDPHRDPARGAQLKAFYQRADARFYHVAGRCLLGIEPDETLLLSATTPHRRAEVSYYLGIKALSQRRYTAAVDWLRVTVETRSERDWEILWAKDLLTRWTNTGRTLAVAVPQVAATPPTW